MDTHSLNRLLGYAPRPRCDLLMVAGRCHGENYIVLWSAGEEEVARFAVTCWKLNPELSFNDGDAAAMGEAIENLRCSGK